MMTPRERDVFTYVRSYWADHGMGPTHREIGEHLGGRVLSTVAQHIGSLRRKGLLQGVGYRAVRPTPTATQSCPACGRRFW